MSRFISQPDLKKRKRQKIWDYVTVFLGVLYVSTFFFVDRSFKEDRLFREMQVLFFLYLIYSSARRLFSKRKDVFIEINERHILFRTVPWGSESERTIDWRDIKWIKQENNFSVSVFQASSFSENFSIKGFSVADQERILQEIQSIAREKQVRLVNFSDIFVWAAVPH